MKNGCEIINDEQITGILSMAKYWREVSRRGYTPKIDEILYEELYSVVQILGVSILWILEDWCLTNK